MTCTVVQIRRALMAALDEPGVYVASTGTTSTATVGGLVDATANASPNRLNARWVFNAGPGPGFGFQRRIRAGSFLPASGTFSFDPTGTAPASGDELEITGAFASYGAGIGDDTGYDRIIDRGLSKLLEPDRISVDIAANEQEYSLATWAAWLDRPSRVASVYDPPRGPDFPRHPTWRRWEIKMDGGVPTLQFHDRGYRTAAGTIELAVRRPANTLVNGAEVTGVLYTGTVLPDINAAVTVCLAEAYMVLMNRNSAYPSDPQIGAKYAAALEAALALPNYDPELKTAPQPAQGVV